MADEFLQGVAQGRELVMAGEQIRNMLAMRQERMMQLRAEEAMNAVRERYMAAQADALAVKIEEKKAIDDSIAKADLMHKTILETGMPGVDPEDTATKNKLAQDAVDKWLLANNPSAAKLVFDGRVSQARAENLARNGGTTPHQQVLEGIQLERLGIDKAREQRLVKGEARLEGREARIASRFNLSEADKAQIRSIHKEIDQLNKERLELDPEKNRTQRFKLAMQAGNLIKRADAIAKKGQPQAGGVTVPKGKVLVRKDGQLGYVPESQLEDALSEGYEQVDEEADETTPDDEGAE